MVQFRHSTKEIQFKVVYYGPALGGKTTNLEALHEITDPEGLTQLVSLKTAEDRTLFFDFLPFDVGEIQGYHIRFQVYTVPGQVHYNTTRKVVMAGTDAIIFVADSQPDRAEENYISWENLKANLMANKLDMAQIPTVIQCNKRDLPGALPQEEILRVMRVDDGATVTLASALHGDGVVETFLLCVQRSLAYFAEKFKLDQKGVTADRIADGVLDVFSPFLLKRRKAEPPPPEAEAKVEAKVPVYGLSEEEQLVAALQSTTVLAEQYQEAQELSRMYQARLSEMTILHDVGTSLVAAESVDEAIERSASILYEAKKSWKVSAFRDDSDGPAPVGCFGMPADPLWKADAPGAGNLGLGLLQRGERTRLDKLQERFQRLRAAPSPDVGEAMSIPLGAPGRRQGYLIVYTPSDKVFSREDERFFSLFEQVLSPRLQALKLVLDLAAANERLEVKVVERTADLQQAMRQLEELDQLKRAFLNNVSHEMKTPLTNIRSYADLLKRHPQKRLEKGDEYLDIIRDETSKLEGLISDLLTYTKIKEPPRGESSDLLAVLDEVVKGLTPQADAKQIKLQIQRASEVLFYDMNKEDATILFKHVADNAIKFSPEGVKVKIYLLHDAKKVVFAVRDYGPGFPKDQRERLLEPIEPGKPAVPSFKNPGLGMGLFLVKEVLSKYGGSIAIENMEPGSNVLIELPKRGGEGSAGR